jgi:hypothetical protein
VLSFYRHRKVLCFTKEQRFICQKLDPQCGDVTGSGVFKRWVLVVDN